MAGLSCETYSPSHYPPGTLIFTAGHAADAFPRNVSPLTNPCPTTVTTPGIAWVSGASRNARPKRKIAVLNCISPTPDRFPYAVMVIGGNLIAAVIPIMGSGWSAQNIIPSSDSSEFPAWPLEGTSLNPASTGVNTSADAAEIILTIFPTRAFRPLYRQPDNCRPVKNGELLVPTHQSLFESRE